MVHINACKGSEIRRLEVEQGTTFAQLKNLILQLFGLNQENTVLINHCDKDGDIIDYPVMLSYRQLLDILGKIRHGNYRLL